MPQDNETVFDADFEVVGDEETGVWFFQDWALSIGRDAELRYTPQGTAVINLALAFNYGRKDQSGNKSTQWVEAVLWGKQAEELAQYLPKGKQVNVTLREPHIETFDKQNEQGFKLIGDVVTLTFTRPQQEPQQRPQPQPVKQQASPTNNTMDDYDSFDDPIPF